MTDVVWEGGGYMTEYVRSALASDPRGRLRREH